MQYAVEHVASLKEIYLLKKYNDIKIHVHVVANFIFNYE